MATVIAKYLSGNSWFYHFIHICNVTVSVIIIGIYNVGLGLAK